MAPTTVNTIGLLVGQLFGDFGQRQVIFDEAVFHRYLSTIYLVSALHLIR